MHTRTTKTLTAAAVGLAAVAAGAAGTGSAHAADMSGVKIGTLPVKHASELVPGAVDSASGAQAALREGTSALPAPGLLPSGNHLSGNEVAPVTGLIGGLPAGSGVLGA
jgi:hypothetical protein